MALQSVLKTFSAQVPSQELHTHIRSHHTIFLEHFVESTHSLLAAKLAQTYDKVLIIHADTESAEFMQSDLNDLDVGHAHYFPETGMHPYDDQQITDSSVVVQRSEVLENIRQQTRCVLVTSAAAIFDKIVAPEVFSETSITINSGGTIQFDKLKEELVDQEYDPVTFVSQPGEFAHRGGILDIFPYTGDYPVRLEFFGDVVDSIREFDPDSQRSISLLDTGRLVPDASSLTQDRKTVG